MLTLTTSGAGLMLSYKRDSSLGSIIGTLITLGIGIGCTFQTTIIALQSHVMHPRRAVIISNRNFFRCAGGAAGLAISAAILQAVLKANLPTSYQNLANDAYAPPKVEGPDSDAVLNAYMAASRAVFILQLPLVTSVTPESFIAPAPLLAYTFREDEVPHQGFHSCYACRFPDSLIYYTIDRTY